MLAFLEWLSFEGLLQWAKDAAVAVWDFIVGMIWPYLEPLWLAVCDAFVAIHGLLATATQSLSAIAPYVAAANAWVPFDVIIQCLIAYMAFWIVLVTYRSIKKWIPTLSG
jgi:hypothetical protein